MSTRIKKDRRKKRLREKMLHGQIIEDEFQSLASGPITLVKLKRVLQLLDL